MPTEEPPTALVVCPAAEELAPATAEAAPADAEAIAVLLAIGIGPMIGRTLLSPKE